jgi:hypothetical protein
VTHHRERKKAARERSHARHVEKTYGLTQDEYARIYVAQGSRCWICQKATGARKKLAVDHDHDTMIVRGLLCSRCNYTLLGQYSQEALSRALAYLQRPPAPVILGYTVRAGEER